MLVALPLHRRPVGGAPVPARIAANPPLVVLIAVPREQSETIAGVLNRNGYVVVQAPTGGVALGRAPERHAAGGCLHYDVPVAVEDAGDRLGLLSRDGDQDDKRRIGGDSGR